MAAERGCRRIPSPHRTRCDCMFVLTKLTQLSFHPLLLLDVVSIDHSAMECKMRSRSQWDRKLQENGTSEYFDCCHHDMIVCAPFYARHTKRRWVRPIALRLTNRRSYPHGSHDWRHARPAGERPHACCAASQSNVDRVAPRRHNAGRHSCWLPMTAALTA
jgi:hypothetical protein